MISYEVHIIKAGTEKTTAIVSFRDVNGAMSYACPFVKGGKSEVRIYKIVDGQAVGRVPYYS